MLFLYLNQMNLQIPMKIHKSTFEHFIITNTILIKLYTYFEYMQVYYNTSINKTITSLHLHAN